jgi:hypothetical protein
VLTDELHALIQARRMAVPTADRLLVNSDDLAHDLGVPAHRMLAAIGQLEADGVLGVLAFPDGGAELAVWLIEVAA